MPRYPHEPFHASVTPLSLDAIARAADAIDPVFLDSPVFAPPALAESLGCQIALKVETLNPIRSFKGRGAENFVQSLGGSCGPLVCASAGNFGQGMAWATRRRGIPLHVFASVHANPMKVRRMEAFGATVHRAGEDFDSAKETALAWASARGFRYVEDGRESAIAEGAATIAVELLSAGHAGEVLVVPLGNGALLGGMATWVGAHAPDIEVVGVCARGAPSMYESWKAGRVIETATADTIADGIAVRVPIPEALATLGSVTDIVLVEDAQIREAMNLLLRDAGLLIEPAGAAGLAAVLADPARFAGRAISTVLCGSNLADPPRI